MGARSQAGGKVLKMMEIADFGSPPGSRVAGRCRPHALKGTGTLGLCGMIAPAALTLCQTQRRSWLLGRELAAFPHPHPPLIRTSGRPSALRAQCRLPRRTWSASLRAFRAPRWTTSSSTRCRRCKPRCRWAAASVQPKRSWPCCATARVTARSAACLAAAQGPCVCGVGHTWDMLRASGYSRQGAQRRLAGETSARSILPHAP